MKPAIRKAAMVYAALDASSAAALLAPLGEKTAKQIREAARTLKNIDPQEQQAVMAEFFASRDHRPTSPEEKGPAERLAAESNDEAVFQHHNAPPGPKRPFHFLESVDPTQLARRLHAEHPQTIAIVVAHAPRRLAADLLWRLPESLRTDVLLRVVDWQGAEPQLLEELEHGLEVSLAATATHAGGSTGLDAVREILQAATEEERGELLNDMARRDAGKADLLRRAAPAATVRSAAPEIASAPATSAPSASAAAVMTPAGESSPGDEPAPTIPFPKLISESKPKRQTPAPEPQIAFADFLRFDDRSLLRVLAAADPQTSLLALTGASPQLVGRLMRRLPRKEAAALRRRMESLGSFRLQDIETAQRNLARVASRLLAQRTIRVTQSRRAA